MRYVKAFEQAKADARDRVDRVAQALEGRQRELAELLEKVEPLREKIDAAREAHRAALGETYAASSDAAERAEDLARKTLTAEERELEALEAAIEALRRDVMTLGDLADEERRRATEAILEAGRRAQRGALKEAEAAWAQMRELLVDVEAVGGELYGRPGIVPAPVVDSIVGQVESALFGADAGSVIPGTWLRGVG